MKKCKNCHGESGNADTKMGRAHKIPDWTVPGWRTEWPLEKIKDIIEHGKPKTKMKAFEFSDEELDALARYVRSLGR
jgi:mono/diheme cytochrome c family protein